MSGIKKSDVAASIPFDNENTNFISDTVEGAIKEINSAALAGGRVNSDGSSNRILNASSARLSTGEYRITFDTAVTDADYPIIITLESNAGSDDYIVSYSNLTINGFDVSINEQDNGGSPGTSRDNAFSFLVPNISTQAGPENDHGALVGLGDDDHPQYLNNSRGDARYYTQTQIDTQQQAQDDNLNNHLNDTTDAHDASAISFDNTVTGDLTADNVQDAIDEISSNSGGGAVDSVNGQTGVVVLDADDIDDSTTNNKFATQAELDQINTNLLDISELELNQDDLIALSGVPENSTNLGVFSGSLIPNNQDIKQALQELENILETHAIRHLPNGVDALDTDVAATLNANTANLEGSANSFARSDHSHNISTGSASTINANGTNTEGSSSNIARADHTHAINVDPSPIVGVTSAQLQGALEELGQLGGARELFFQFIGQMNFDSYLVSGAHITNNGIRRSGDPSNGARFTNAAPLMSPIDGEIFAITLQIRGAAQSTGSPAAIVNCNLEVWEVGQDGSEGTKLGDIAVPIDSSVYTIGNFWNSSIITEFGEEYTLPSPISVSAGKLIGLKFDQRTGNNNVTSLNNISATLAIRR